MKKVWLLLFTLSLICTGCAANSITAKSASQTTNHSDLHMQIFSTAKGQHLDLKFKLIGGQHVDAAATLTAQASMSGMNPIPISIQKVDNTTYKGSADLTMSGTWIITADWNDSLNQKQFTSSIALK